VATTTMATVDNILKEVYEGDVNDQLQSDITALKRIERSSEGVTHHVGGKYVRFPIRTKRNHGIGSRNENTPLPTARTQGYEDAEVKLKYQYGAIELTGQTFELADKDYQTFASALDQEVEGIKEGLRKDQARQVYGTNLGVMATATAAGTTTTFVLPNEWAIYLEIGMIVDVHDSTSVVGAEVTLGTDREITNIVAGASNTTVTVSPALSGATASGDMIVRAGNFNLEITGLSQIVSDTGAVYDINPTTTPVWKSTVRANGGTPRALSEGLMIETVDQIRRVGGGMPTVIFCGLGVRRAYFQLLVQQRRQTNTQEFTGGFRGLAFVTDNGEIPVISDVDCQPNRMYFVNEKQLKLYNAGDWSFMDRDGSKWQRKITSAGRYDAYEATLYQYNELGTHQRNSHALLSDLIEG
jgi:hypothetical protein